MSSDDYRLGYEDAIEDVGSHWFLQGGSSEFGHLPETDEESADDFIASLLMVLRARDAAMKAEIKALRERVLELKEVEAKCVSDYHLGAR